MSETTSKQKIEIFRDLENDLINQIEEVKALLPELENKLAVIRGFIKDAYLESATQMQPNESSKEFYKNLGPEFKKDWILGQKVFFIVREYKGVGNNDAAKILGELDPERYSDYEKALGVVRTVTSRLKRWGIIEAEETDDGLSFSVPFEYEIY